VAFTNGVDHIECFAAPHISRYEDSGHA